METIVDAATIFAKHWNCKIQDKVLECSIFDKEEECQDIILWPGIKVSKVSFWAIKVKLWTFWSFKHQNNVCHFNTHLVYIKSIFILNHFILVLVLFNEISPFPFGDQVFLIDNEEENEDKTTCHLNVPKNLNWINDPVRNIRLTVVIFSICKKEYEVHHNSDKSWEVFKSSHFLWSDLQGCPLKLFIQIHFIY